MTCRSQIGFTFRLCAALAAVAGLAMLLEISPPAVAAPPPPPGVIYYNFQPWVIKSMNGAGGGAVDALPSAALAALYPTATTLPMPANQLHSGQRWFLSFAQTGTYDTVISSTGTILHDVPHRDLVAVRKRPSNPSQLDVVQLTDLYGIMNVVIQSPYWSNDSNESLSTSFAGCLVQDIRDTFVENADGSTFYEYPQGFKNLRVPVTAGEIARGLVEPVDDTFSDAELDDLLRPWVAGFINQQRTTSPDGTQFVVCNRYRVLIVDAATGDYNNPVRILWDGTTVSPTFPAYPQWSPDGSKIAYAGDTTNVWTIAATGGTPKKILAGTSTIQYTRPLWSADSQHVVAVKNTYSGTTLIGTRLVRVPANGGTITELRAVGTGTGYALRWVPNN